MSENRMIKIMIFVIMGYLLTIIMYLSNIKSELEHAKDLLHLQNDITNQLLIKISNKR